MAISGFGNNEEKKDKVTDSNQNENYKHVVKLFGIPVHWVNRSHGWSTTKFKQAIADTL